jgi:hypothetical protein
MRLLAIYLMIVKPTYFKKRFIEESSLTEFPPILIAELQNPPQKATETKVLKWEAAYLCKTHQTAGLDLILINGF